jgi:hypothetical protein
MVFRLVLVLALIAVCSATSCITTTGIAVRPSALVDSTTLAESAFAVVGRVTQQHGLLPRSPAKLGLNDLSMCYKRDYQNRDLVLCGKTKNTEVHFMLRESMTSQFTPQADSLRRALLDSLRIHFGDQFVRECKWEFERDATHSGC